MNATEEKPQQINGLQDQPSSIHDRTSANDTGTDAKIDTPLTQPGSPPVRYWLIDKYGNQHGPFSGGDIAGLYAKARWPDQEQDCDRTGRGWDVEAVDPNLS